MGPGNHEKGLVEQDLRGQIVFDIDTSPGGVDAHGEFFTAPGRSAWVRHDDGVAVRGKELRIETELGGVLRLGSAVRAKQRGRFYAAGRGIDRMNEKAVDLNAVFAFEFRFIDGRQF